LIYFDSNQPSYSYSSKAVCKKYITFLFGNKLSDRDRLYEPWWATMNVPKSIAKVYGRFDNLG